MPNKEFGRKNCRRDYTNPLLENTNRKILLMTTVFNQLFFDQREKVLIGKRIAFSVEKSVCR